MQHDDSWKCSCGVDGTQCMAHTLSEFQRIMANPGAERDQFINALKYVGADPKSAAERVNETLHACGVCGKQSTAHCSRCKVRYYCSRDCQRADWKAHKPNCKPRTSPAAE